MLRTAIILFAWLCVGSGVAPCAGQGSPFPLQGLVVRDGALVYSGPGKMHYPTEELTRGTAVEVWRLDPGGWCAVRPGGNSFSLIPDSAVERIEDRLGRIREDGIQAWVGTRLGPVEQPLWQVTLQKGESVEILGEASWPSPEGFSTTWLQIAAPAGEFRWIHRDDLQLPESPARKDAAPSSGNDLSSGNERVAGGKPQAERESGGRTLLQDPAVTPASAVQDPAMIDDPFAGLDLPVSESRGAATPAPESSRSATMAQLEQLDRAISGRSGGSSPSDGFRDAGSSPAGSNNIDGTASLGEEGWRPARSPLRLASLANNDRALSGAGPAALSRDPGLTGPGSTGPGFSGQRNEATSGENRGGWSGSAGGLSNLAANPATPSVDDLMARFKADSPVVPTWGQQPLAADLGGLDLQLAGEIIKPAEYWDLERISTRALQLQASATSDAEREQAGRLIRKIEDLRRTRGNLLASASAATPAAVASRDRPVGAGLDTSVELNATYDAHGWLNELVQDNGSMEPAYVLQDSTGRIVSRVTPSPGLNLRRYLKARVGIMGQRGYDQRLKLNHITADQIIVLEAAAASTARRFNQP